MQPVADATPDAAALLGRSRDRCVFYDDATEDGRCRIHAALGHDALPLSCRQFPRVSLLDPRGVSVTLSHYCPTAAALLDADVPPGPTIVVDAPAFPVRGEYIGLDARAAWPPLVRRDLLMDWDAWWEFERLAVELLLAEDDDAVASLTRLRAVVDDLQDWSPSKGPLIDRIHDAFDRSRRAETARQPADPSLVDAVFDAVPADIRPSRFDGVVKTSGRAAKRFCAAHAFANWNIHSDRGLGVWMRSIDAAAALIDAGAGVRNADLLIRHLADGERLLRNF